MSILAITAGTGPQATQGQEMSQPMTSPRTLGVSGTLFAISYAAQRADLFEARVQFARWQAACTLRRVEIAKLLTEARQRLSRLATPATLPFIPRGAR